MADEFYDDASWYDQFGGWDNVSADINAGSGGDYDFSFDVPYDYSGWDNLNLDSLYNDLGLSDLVNVDNLGYYDDWGLPSLDSSYSDITVYPSSESSLGDSVLTLAEKESLASKYSPTENYLGVNTEDRTGIKGSLFDTLEGVEGVEGLGSGLRGKVTSEGLDQYSAHVLPGGLVVESGDNGLRTGSAKDYFDDELGTGLLIEGTPNKPTSLNDLALLGDEDTLDKWAANKDLSWQDYANSQGYQALAEKLGIIGTSPTLQKLQSKYSSPRTPAQVTGGKTGTTSGKTPTTGGKVNNAITSTTGGLAALLQALMAFQKDSKPPKPMQSRAATKMTWKRMAEGGGVGGECETCQGGLGLLRSKTGGQTDNKPIIAAGGEYVMDADTVAALGDGNTEAGAALLDEMRYNIRKHKRSAPPDKIPPKAKRPEAYLKGKKRG